MNIGLKGAWKKTKGNSLKFRLKELYWDIYYAWKRVWDGYDDRDIFDMSDMFRDRYIAILKDYNKNRHCCWNVPEQYRDVLGQLFFTDEQTKVIIDMMIFHLEMMDEDYAEKYIYGKNCFDKDYDWLKDFNLKKCNHIRNVVEQNKELFMEMFNIFFLELWD